MTGPGDWDPERCDFCLECVEACPAAALVTFGDRRSIDALLEQLRPEYDLYRRSGGGVTFSGGETTLFASYASRLAQGLQDEGIHVAIETCGLFKIEAIEDLLGATDLLLYDIKLFSDAEHRQYCGSGNASIKANLEILVARAQRHEGPRVWPRLPVIPGVTDTEENLEGWATCLRALGLDGLTLVPYHELGSGKRMWLRESPPAPQLGSLSDQELDRCRRTLTNAGVRCFAPGDEPWSEAYRGTRC